MFFYSKRKTIKKRHEMMLEFEFAAKDGAISNSNINPRLFLT